MSAGTAAWYAGPVPADHRGRGLHLVPLGPHLATRDHQAVMASTEQLRGWSRSDWPADDFPLAANRADLVAHEDEHRERVAFTYTVLDDDDIVVGCVYLLPFADALRSRGVEPPALAEPAPADVCARGWIRSDADGSLLDALVAEVIGWLTGPDWDFPRAWWQAHADSTDQLAAATRAGLEDEVVVPDGQGSSWRFLRAA